MGVQGGESPKAPAILSKWWVNIWIFILFPLETVDVINIKAILGRYYVGGGGHNILSPPTLNIDIIAGWLPPLLELLIGDPSPPSFYSRIMPHAYRPTFTSQVPMA